MTHQTILKLLDENKFAELSKADLTRIEEHAAVCQICRKALSATRISAVLFENPQAHEIFEPSPFFQTKVLTAWREKQAIQKPLAAFYRWWQASAALIVLMLMTVAGLIALTAFAPNSSQNEIQANQQNFNLYSTDAIILNQQSAKKLTAEQVLQVLDNTRNDANKRK